MKRIFLVFLLLALYVPCYSLEIDNEELNKAKKVQFLNYSGLDTKSITSREIDSIGRTLAKPAPGKSTVRFYLKYSITRADSPDEPTLLSADIFSIDPAAKVNHVNVIRRIISSYVATRFGYNRQESDAIALVVTYYNAIYRGDLSYIGSRYKKVVTDQMTLVNAGLSTKYYEWPGKTKIIIPLTENASKRVDLFAVTDDKVFNELRTRSDKGVSSRKEIVSIKEKQITDEKKDLTKKENDLATQKENVIKKEETIKNDKTEIEKEKRTIGEDKKKADVLKNPEEKRIAEREIAKKENDVVEKEKITREKEQDLEKEKLKNSQTEKQIADKKSEIEKKEKNIENEKKSIEEDTLSAKEKSGVNSSESRKRESPDQKKLDAEKQKIAHDTLLIAAEKKDLEKKKDEMTAKIDKVYKDKLYYLKVNNWFNDGVYNNEMYIINPSTRKIILKSPYHTIAGRKFDIFPKGVVVIGYEGKDKENFEHKLVLLSHDKLTSVMVGKDVIFWRSFVEIRDNNIYCILSEGGKFYLARYNDDLERTGKSVAEVDKDSVISFYESFIYINSADRKIMVLKKDDLSYIQTIDPGKDVE